MAHGLSCLLPFPFYYQIGAIYIKDLYKVCLPKLYYLVSITENYKRIAWTEQVEPTHCDEMRAAEAVGQSEIEKRSGHGAKDDRRVEW